MANATTTAVAGLQDNLLDTVHRTGHFKYLMAAVRATGLTDTFNGAGPFTLFAPNDYAFGKLAKSLLVDLFKLENKGMLTSILKLHFVTGRVSSSDCGGMPSVLRSLQGEDLTVNTAQGLRVNNVRIVERDMEASNGVVHAIETVLMPADG